MSLMHQVVGTLVNHRHRLSPVAGRFHLASFFGQHVLHGGPDDFLIVGDEHRLAREDRIVLVSTSCDPRMPPTG